MEKALIILSIESISIVFIMPIVELLHAGHVLREDISRVLHLCHAVSVILYFNILND